MSLIRKTSKLSKPQSTVSPSWWCEVLYFLNYLCIGEYDSEEIDFIDIQNSTFDALYEKDKPE